MNGKRAEVIAASKLSQSVEKAVVIATKRLGVKAEKQTLILNWAIIGRILRELESFAEAQEVATEVTKAIRLPGITAYPACAKVSGGILVGFIQRSAAPLALE